MFMTIALKLYRWHLYRETVRELQKLSDRELSDLGIGRWRIKAIAHDAVARH